jgi:GntR family transcriptional regulator/MocR family aminotransferase
MKARQINDWHGCSLTQTALARFMLDGHFGRHLRRVQKHYAGRRSALLEHLTGELAPWFDPIAPAAGIHLTARLRGGLDEIAVIDAARKKQIGLYGIAGFHAGRRRGQGLLFGYGDIRLDALHASMTTLKTLLAKAAR